MPAAHRLPVIGFALGASLFGATSATAAALDIVGTAGTTLSGSVLETFDGPWAMTYLADGRALVTEQGGTVWLLDEAGVKLTSVAGVPEVLARGQGGLGDIIAAPEAGENVVYLSYVEHDGGSSGAVVVQATLQVEADSATFVEMTRIWEQVPKVPGNGHYGHRLAISPDRYLFITSGERQKFTPAQDMQGNLGKVVRLNLDGSVPADNPFADQGGVAAQVWTLGHRNPLGIDFDSDDQLWVHEMGPKGGDELNRIVAAQNYGYPEVSDGSHYSGEPIPDHDTRPEFATPALSWNPSISPAGFVIHDGRVLPDWQGHGLIGGLSSQALIRVRFDGPAGDGDVVEAERYSWGKRIREVEQGPDGAVHVLEDEAGGRLIRLDPAD